MFRTILRTTAALVVTLAATFTAAPVVATAPLPSVTSVTGTHHALLADVAQRAAFLAKLGDTAGARLMRSNLRMLDDRGTHGVAGSLA